MAFQSWKQPQMQSLQVFIAQKSKQRSREEKGFTQEYISSDIRFMAIYLTYASLPPVQQKQFVGESTELTLRNLRVPSRTNRRCFSPKDS